MFTKKINIEQFLIFFSLSIILSLETISTTMLNSILPAQHHWLSLIAVFTLLARFSFLRRFSYFDFIALVMILLLGVAIFVSTRNVKILMYLLLLVGLYKVNVDDILKIYLVIVGGIVLLIFLLAIIGAIPNLHFVQYRGIEQVTRIAFGSIYPTDFAAHCFYLYAVLSYLLFKKRSLIAARTILGLFLSIFVAVYCNARLNALSLLFATILFLFYHFFPKMKLPNLLSLIYPVSATFIYFVSKFFDPFNPIYRRMNEFFNSRLYLGRLAFERYHIGLFGNKDVEFIGFGGNTDSTSIQYNYVDSSYLQILFLFGSILAITLLIIAVTKLWSLNNKGEFLLFSLMCLIAVNCIFEAFLINPSYNIFYFILFGVFATGANQDKMAIPI